MKMKALVVLVLCVMGLAAMGIGSANATGWYNCTISKVGATQWGVYFVTVTDTGGAFNTMNFQIEPTGGYARDMYAAALTAWSNGSNAWIYLNAAPVNWGVTTGVAAITQ